MPIDTKNASFYFQGDTCLLFRDILIFQRQIYERSKCDHARYCTQTPISSKSYYNPSHTNTTKIIVIIIIILSLITNINNHTHTNTNHNMISNYDANTYHNNYRLTLIRLYYLFSS